MKHRVVDSPLGRLVLVVDDAGALAGVHHERDAAPVDWGEPDDSVAQDAADQLAEYFAGTRREFNLALAPRGTPFQLRVWTALRDIGYGETESYGHLAARIGMPGAARAVGGATGRNPISFVIPCHRLIGSAGTLTGYGGGLERKRWLLDLEAASPPVSPSVSPRA